MSGIDDVLLRDLKVEHVKCRGEVTMADFSEDEESIDETRPVLTGNTGGSSEPLSARGTVNKAASNSKKRNYSKKMKPRKKKDDGPFDEMPLSLGLRKVGEFF